MSSVAAPVPPVSAVSDDSSSASKSVSSSVPIICPGHSRPVPEISFTPSTPDGYFLISSCLDNRAMIRDGATGDWIGTLIGHKGAAWSARLNSSANLAATGAADFSAKLWDAIDGSELYTFTHRHIVKSVRFSNDSQFLFTGGQEKKIRVFDLNAPEAAPQMFEGHGASVLVAAPLPDSNLILSAAQEADLRVWDRRTGQLAQTISTDAAAVAGVHISLDGSTLSVATAGNKKVAFYSTSDFSLIKSHTLPVQADCIGFDPVHSRFATGCDNELWLRLYDLDSANEIACLKGHHGPVRSIAFTESGMNFASGSVDGTIRIWSHQVAK